MTPDGTVHRASEHRNPELFSQIRTLGPKVGVCTVFSVRLHPQRRTVYAGSITLPFTELNELIGVTDDWWERGPSEVEAMIQVVTIVGGQVNSSPIHRSPCVLTRHMQPTIHLYLFYNGSESQGRRAFRKFLNLGLAGFYIERIRLMQRV